MRRFDPLEVALIALFVGSATFSLTHHYYQRLWSYARYPLDERAALAEKYGPHTYALGVDEWVIRDYFHDKRGGTFLDVGASHYKAGSNTYYLETQLGWSGVAIDARSEFGPDYQRHRPRTRFVAMFAADADHGTARLFVPADNGFVASASQDLAHAGGQRTTARDVPTTTLNAVLEQAGIAAIDLLNMDIELSEPKALAGLDVEKYRPALVCIEAHRPVRQQILNYFAQHRYQLVGQYLRVDPTNLYFVPADHPTTSGASTR
jgi:FkbM family methyltransferase